MLLSKLSCYQIFKFLYQIFIFMYSFSIIHHKIPPTVIVNGAEGLLS